MLPFGGLVANADHWGLNVGGSTPNYRVRIGGQDYFVKELHNPPDPRRELWARKLAKIAGVPSVPCRAVWVRHRTMAIVYEWFEGHSFEVLSWRGEDVVARVQSLPPDDIARVVLFDFLTGHTDAHLGNYMASADNKLLGIDREQILGRNPMAKGYTLAGYHRLLRAAVGIAQIGPLRTGDSEKGRAEAGAYPLPHAMLRAMAEVSLPAAGFLLSQGEAAAADFVTLRGVALSRVAMLPNPCVADLDAAVR